MIYYYNAYAPDLASLKISIARLRELDPAAIVYVGNDPAAPIRAQIPGAHLIPTQYPRGGNLNGAPCIFGMLDTMAGIMTHHGASHIVKIDADAFLNSVHWLDPEYYARRYDPATARTPADVIYMEGRAPFSVSGDCYCISAHAVRAVRRALIERTKAAEIYREELPEDATILTLATRAGLHVEAIPYFHGMHRGITSAMPSATVMHAALIHAGEPLADGTRAPREFVAFKMSALWHLTHTAH